ncbi:hypothetical protein BGZ83_000942 [Gryganskiella cystojenkinii]|nr:hypothetical protein BGZ83_000942 [Gryganskiella cystojenkinii]
MSSPVSIASSTPSMDSSTCPSSPPSSHSSSDEELFYEPSTEELDLVDQLLLQYAQDPLWIEHLQPLHRDDKKKETNPTTMTTAAADKTKESSSSSRFIRPIDLETYITAASLLEQFSTSQEQSPHSMPMPSPLNQSASHWIPATTTTSQHAAAANTTVSSYSFLAPIRAETFEVQNLPRKRGRPVLVRMDQSSPLTPADQITISSTSPHANNGRRESVQQVLWCINASAMVSPSPSSASTSLSILNAPPLNFPAEGFTSIHSSQFSYFPYIPNHPLPVLPSKTNVATPCLPFFDMSSCSTSPASYASSQPSLCSSFGFTASVDPPLSPAPPLLKLKSKKSSKPNNSKPTDFFFAPPFQYTDSKIDRRSFNSRKELKYAQAQAQQSPEYEQTPSSSIL